MDVLPNKTWIDSRVEIRDSSVSGRGSFAREPIAKGEIVIRWGGGVIVADEEFQQGLKAGIYQPDTAIHFDEHRKWAQRAADPDEADPYLNHSCDPNLCFTGGWPLAARRNITAGEELTFDYATGETYPLQGECRCGAPRCRKQISGEEWKDLAFREKYKGHFSPYIQDLIEKEYLAE